jgi:hypothetical protein
MVSFSSGRGKSWKFGKDADVPQISLGEGSAPAVAAQNTYFDSEMPVSGRKLSNQWPSPRDCRTGEAKVAGGRSVNLPESVWLD